VKGPLEMAGESQIAQLLREIRQTVSDAVGDSERRISERVSEVASDAKEARDGVIGITAKLEEQNVGAALAAVRAEAKTGLADLRSDVVNQNARLKTEITGSMGELEVRVDGLNGRIETRFAATDTRLAALEKIANQDAGKNTVFGWMLRHLPGPMIAAVGTFLTMIGLDKRL
jgi:methyl-accepting chemotaxis protein